MGIFYKILARRGKRPKNLFFCIFARHSYRYNIYQVRMEFRKLFYILVHPNAHACFPNTKINTTRKYTNTKYIELEIIPKCYQILGPIGKNIMHILTWNHFGCQSLKERFFRDTLYTYLQELVQGYTVGKFWFFSYAYALNFINHCFGSLFWLPGVPIGSLFHKKLGPYFKAWGSLQVYVTVKTPKRSLYGPSPYNRDPLCDSAFWVPIGSLFIFQGPYFQCFGFIHAKNVNSVCLHVYSSELTSVCLHVYRSELTWFVCDNFLHCYYTNMLWSDASQVILLANFVFFLCVKFHKSLFWVPILAAGGPYWVLISSLGIPIGSFFHSLGVPGLGLCHRCSGLILASQNTHPVQWCFSTFDRATVPRITLLQIWCYDWGTDWNHRAKMVFLLIACTLL